MFVHTDIPESRWYVVESDDKQTYVPDHAASLS
jgi:polyphosphate kinase 2 (PPK2 family)